MQCPQCTGEQFTKAGRNRQQRQLYRCRACGRRISARSGSTFSGERFPDACKVRKLHMVRSTALCCLPIVVMDEAI